MSDEKRKAALKILSGWAASGKFPLGDLEVEAALETVEELDEQLEKRARAQTEALNDRVMNAALTNGAIVTVKGGLYLGSVGKVHGRESNDDVRVELASGDRIIVKTRDLVLGETMVTKQEERAAS